MAELQSGTRVKASDVAEIIHHSLDDAQVHWFINMANTMVDNNLSGVGLDTATLTQIEALLSAHFLTLHSPRAASDSPNEGYSITYQGETGKGLESSIYGQNALALDHTGTLAQLSTEGGKRQSVVSLSREDAWTSASEYTS